MYSRTESIDEYYEYMLVKYPDDFKKRSDERFDELWGTLLDGHLDDGDGEDVAYELYRLRKKVNELWEK